MGIKCSLFGHAFGETTVDREREEQGSEVVITIREQETCKRCGETRVVSENKEVTTVETPEDVDIDDETSDVEDTGGAEGSVPPTDASSGAEIVDAEAGEPVETDDEAATDADGSSPEPATETARTEDEGPSAAEDDGVILEDDEADEPAREPGEWPDETEPAQPATEQPPVPDLEPAENPEQDAEGDRDRPDEEVPSAERPADSAVWSETDPDLDEDRNTGGAVTVPAGTFRCSECGFTTPVDASSLREGDYCPECHRGTLVIESE